MPTKSVDLSITRSENRSPIAAATVSLPAAKPATSTANGATSESTVSSPQVLGIWHLGQRIHSSSQSLLFTAQPADAIGSPRFDYVIRTVPADQATVQRNQSLSQLTRFVSAAATVRHPNLIAVLDSSLQSSTPYLTMPRLAGQTLHSWLLRKETGVRLPVAIWFVRQVSQALGALHNATLLHGDITPRNIHLSVQGHVTLLDLGFTRRPVTSDAGPTVDSGFLGTPQYAAPECFESDFSLASDIFSLGKVFMELIAHSEPQVQSQSLLEPVADLIAQMLQPSPSDRPTIAEVTKRLLRLEFETLGEHIQPANSVQRHAA